jgi:cytochrome oxidase Cu insertion factor (SCO1/SenC/PrrC family)
MSSFDGATPLADMFAAVDRLRALPGSGNYLANLLPEQSAIYVGRPSGDAERLRGYVLASFEQTGLPETAMAFVVEELESGDSPYVVAAAAKAARGANAVPEHIVSLLLDAIERISQSDDVVRFKHDEPLENGAAATTALMELFRTLAWLGARASTVLPSLEAMLQRRPSAFSDAVRADIENAITAISRADRPKAPSCCADKSFSEALIPLNRTDVDDIELQDQDGKVFCFRDFFLGRISVLAFFYTRCMNPNKCSLTITKLARLQQLARDAGLHDQINIAAITYDPAFDLPKRLYQYGANRGLSFDDRTRLMRSTGPFDPFRHRFELGVGYGSATVNQHRLDALVLDRRGWPIASYPRIQWREEDLLGALRSSLDAAAGAGR